MGNTIPASMICTCLRCGATWIRRVADLPVQCPRCKSRVWRKPKREGAKS